jgi:hypothetical protein
MTIAISHNSRSADASPETSMETLTVSLRHEPPDAEVTSLIRAVPGVPNGTGDDESALGDGEVTWLADAAAPNALLLAP